MFSPKLSDYSGGLAAFRFFLKKVAYSKGHRRDKQKTQTQSRVEEATINKGNHIERSSAGYARETRARATDATHSEMETQNKEKETAIK